MVICIIFEFPSIPRPIGSVAAGRAIIDIVNTLNSGIRYSYSLLLFSRAGRARSPYRRSLIGCWRAFAISRVIRRDYSDGNSRSGHRRIPLTSVCNAALWIWYPDLCGWWAHMDPTPVVMLHRSTFGSCLCVMEILGILGFLQVSTHIDKSRDGGR